MSTSDSQLPTELPPAGGLPRLQFSLWTVLLVITLVAVTLGMWQSINDGVKAVAVTLFFVVVPVPLLVSALLARGEVQAFSIGAVVPWITFHYTGGSLIYLSMSRNNFGGGPPQTMYAIAVAGLIVTSALSGLVAVLTRRWLARRGFLR